MFFFLRLDLKITFRADRCLATLCDVIFGVVHKTNGTFAVCFRGARVRSLEPGGQFAISN